MGKSSNRRSKRARKRANSLSEEGSVFIAAKLSELWFAIILIMYYNAQLFNLSENLLLCYIRFFRKEFL